MSEFGERLPNDGEDEDGMIRRTFAADISEGDGRTVDVRIVPYGERITHNDGYADGRKGRGPQYTEEWAPGVFSHQMNAANRVLVNVEHEEGIGGIVGHGKALLERHDGFYGSFKLHENSDGEKALMLVREGILDGVSLEALPIKTEHPSPGLVRRVKANLYNIALTRKGAFKGSVVLALREEMIVEEELLPLALDPAIVQRCRALGVRLPTQLKAHPVEGTPAESGTPGDGTRQETSIPESTEVTP